MKITKHLLTACIAIAVTGCKLSVVVPQGGSVKSSSGTYSCDGGTEGGLCTFDLTGASLPFSESFTAIAKPGFQFVKWQQSSGGFLCSNSTSPICTVSLPNDASGSAVLASVATSYLMPIFKDAGVDTDGDAVTDLVDTDDDGDSVLDVDDHCPLDFRNEDSTGCPNIQDTVIVNGREWAQVSLFWGVSYAEIEAVCPGGICANSGSLRGYNMTGWHWATDAEVAEMVAHYFGRVPSVTSPTTVEECTVFTADWRFRNNIQFNKFFAVDGLTFSSGVPSVSFFAMAGPDGFGSPVGTCISGNINADYELVSPVLGGWFYR